MFFQDLVPRTHMQMYTSPRLAFALHATHLPAIRYKGSSL